MNNLTTEQLESIRSLLVDPLRETVRTEILLSHDRLAAAVEKLADRLAGHIDRTQRRVNVVEREIGRLRTFRHRLVAVYGAVTVLLSIAWSAVRDRLILKLGGKP